MKLTEITVDSSLQGRYKLNQEVIDEYSETIREGGKLPAIKVFRIGSRHYLVDGWHRYFAHKKAGLADIEVDVIDGDMREATLYAIGANDNHGLRRNNDDKRKAIMMLLDDVEWSEWNDSEIAKAARVSRMTVSRIKSALGLKKDEVKIIRDGKEIKLNTANIGSKNEQKFLGVQPDPQESYQDEINAEMEAIVEENEVLTRRLAVASMEASDEEKRLAEDQLTQMAAEIKTLTATLNSAQTQANTYMNQTAELKDQVKYWKRRAEKAEKQLDEFKKLGVSV
jgi:ParB-like chromosome segregation protein Spo0J